MISEMNKKEAARIIGSLGGEKIKKKYGKKYFSEIAKKRWNKKSESDNKK